MLGEFLMWAGPEKIIYSDGCMGLHSQPILEWFQKLEFSQEIVETYGVTIGTADKGLILGGNYARIVGLNVEEVKARIADDEFSRVRAEAGLQAPYSNWRADFEARSATTAAA